MTYFDEEFSLIFVRHFEKGARPLCLLSFSCAMNKKRQTEKKKTFFTYFAAIFSNFRYMYMKHVHCMYYPCIGSNPRPLVITVNLKCMIHKIADWFPITNYYRVVICFDNSILWNVGMS